MTGLWDLNILLIPARTGLKINWSEKAPWHEYIHYFHVNPQILHNHCLQFLQGIIVVHREIKDDRYAKFWGLNKVHYAWSMWKWWMEFAHSGLWTLGCVDLAWYNRQFHGFLAIWGTMQRVLQRKFHLSNTSYKTWGTPTFASGSSFVDRLCWWPY